MDIGALLAASNLEVAAADSAYDTEEFEDEGMVDGNKNGEPIDKLAILKAAAAKVAVEEKRIADRVFNETADDLGEDITSKRMAENDPEAILLNASRTVNEHYNRQDPSEADKFRAAEEKESDHEDEGEEDEDDDEGDPDMNQTLMLAVFNERLEAVKTALRKGAKFNARDRHGWTPLHWAASKGYEDIMECLIDHAKSNHKNVAKYVNAQDALTGWTPMHVACVGGHLGAVEVLLRYKARKNKLNFLKEKPGDCIGKSKHPREIREALGVPLKPPTTAALEGDLDHNGLQGAHDEEDDLFLPSMRGEAKEEPRGAPYGGIPSGRSSGRPPIGGGEGGAGAGVYVPKYERGNNFSTDSYSERSYQEEKGYR